MQVNSNSSPPYHHHCLIPLRTMPSARTPLLAAARPSGESDRSDDLAEQEDSALQPGVGATRRHSLWYTRLRELFLFLWALLATAAVIVLAAWIQHGQQAPNQTLSQARIPTGKRNLIFMVSDGMGPASLALTRSFRQLVDELPINDTLVLDQHFWGSSRTLSSNSLVTDSAAGATAFSCGLKSYNGAISILPDFSPCGTVLEAAKRVGYHTGLVVTTDITDATPACFASHVNFREQMNEIALHEAGEGPLGHVVDLMLGGGRCHFLPNSSAGSCRLDAIDIAGLVQKKGWTYVDDRAGFDSLESGENVELPALGLFASHDIPFELDRRNRADTYPSLSEMAMTALRALERATKHSDKGFFLMIEGSRIDHAGHINDPAAQVREVLEYDKTFKIVLDFLEQSETEGIVISTSDHETGGLSTALQEPGQEPVYNWYPEALARAKASSEYLAHLLHQHVRSLAVQNTPVDLETLKVWINTKLIIPHLGISDAVDKELELLASHPEDAVVIFAEIVSLRAHVGWSTHGHSAVDVNIYSSGGPEAERIRGNVENTDIGKFLIDYLDVDVDEITKELNDKLGAHPPSGGLPGTSSTADFAMKGLDPKRVSAQYSNSP